MATVQSIGQAVIGSTVNTKFSALIPATANLQNSRAYWELLDLEGYVWNNGDCVAIENQPSQTNPNEVEISGEAIIALPSNLVSNNEGSKYQVRYTVLLEEQSPIFVFDQFSLLPQVETAYGGIDQVEMISKNQVRVSLVLPTQLNNEQMQATLQINNVTVAVSLKVEPGVATQTGWLYRAIFPAPKADPNIVVNLEPYTVVWNYPDANNEILTETSRLFMVNSSILDVAREVQSFINRAYTDGGIAPGTTFTIKDVLEYLRIGRDQFNAATLPTNITMVNARGPYRWYWVMYSSAAACRAQYLAEGMKAFDYGGQEVTLNIDRTQYWDTMAQNLEQQVNDQIKQFKTIMYKRGIQGGDGSSLALQATAVGSIGISIHAASPLRAGFFGGFGPIGFMSYMGW